MSFDRSVRISESTGTVVAAGGDTVRILNPKYN